MPFTQTRLQYNVQKKLPTLSSSIKKEDAENNESEALKNSRPTRKYISHNRPMRVSSSRPIKQQREEKNNLILPKQRVQRDQRVVQTRPTPLNSSQCSKRLFCSISDDDDNDEEEQSPTPPKIEKRNISLSKTPTQLISRLQLNSPSAYKNTSCSKSLSPKKLFDKGSNYQSVRQALHSTVPEKMPGREEQLEMLHRFLNRHLEANSSGTLYVSGPPGTGKTACLSKTMLFTEFKRGFKTIYVNCTTMKSSISIFSRISEELNLKVSGKSSKDYQMSIEKYLSTNKKMILLVLDEIDQLDSKNQSVLYTIFEWPSKSCSKLVLVGIANALDLTDRILPRLQARLELKPTLMHFPPYSKDQIIDILAGRLKETDASQVFTATAVQLVAAKVASVSGDARRALDIARRVVEMADNRAMPLKPTTDHVSNTRSPKKTDNGTVKLQEVMSVLNTVYGASQTLDEDCDESFPLQQKIIVCTLVLIISKSSIKDITVGKLHEIYRRVCSNQNLPPVCQAEFLSLCGLVETRGIVSIQTRKEPRLSKVCLQWDVEEVSAVLKDKQLLASIMKDVSCLSK